MSKRYWCPTCGEMESFVFLGIANAIKHRDGCTLREIPVVEPLAVPEVTTWGESGGVDAVCLSVYFDDTIYLRGRLFAPADRNIVAAINYVAGVKR